MQVLQVRDRLSQALLSAFSEEGRLLGLLEDAEQRHTRQALQALLTALKAARKELSTVRIWCMRTFCCTDHGFLIFIFKV